jgi:hypothetical protein
MIPAAMPWIVVAGDPLGIDQIGANPLLGRDPQIAVSRPTSATGFPDSSLGYDGVDMLILGGSSQELLSRLSEPQRQAIAEWIMDGGRVFLTLGESAPELMTAAPWLLSLLPIQQLELSRIDPSAIETFISTQTPLAAFVGVSLPKDRGQILIAGRTTRRESIPVAVEYSVGFGRITIIAADLDREPFVSWPQRLDLITQLTGSILQVSAEPPTTKNRSTSHNDLAGQIRTSLDQFPVKRHFGFSVISLVLMGLIAVIGPLDYLLINRLFGRPLLGWLTFPLAALGLSAILIHQSRPVSARELATTASSDPRRQCNRLEIVDIDAARGLGRGFALHYLYSHDAIRADVNIAESPSLRQMTKRSGRMLTAPFGFPGEAFGGIPIAVEDSRLPIYDLPIRVESMGPDEDRLRTTLQGMPLASRSSKGFMTRSRFVPKLAEQTSLERRPGSELLRGELVNPLPVDLLNGMLIYRNWTYLLPTRFPAGGRIASVDSLRQKNFRWLLSRQESLTGENETAAWNPTGIESRDRIAEMLMFHGASGGTRYTSLRHDPLSFLDLSHVLTYEQCILLGQVADPATVLNANVNGQAIDPDGYRLTLVRVVLPVRDRLRSQ